MDNDSIQKIKDVLDKNEVIGIAVSKNPNLDEMGAALSLYLSLKADGKQVLIASPTEPLVENSSLVGIDKVKTFFASDKGDIIVSFPYTEGDIEKVSYTLEEGYLNILVKGGNQGLSFSEKDVRYKRAGGTPDALFIVGTARIYDLGNLFNPESLKNTTVVNIDNKQDNQGFGDVVYVSQSASSVSEQVANVLTSLSLPMDTDIAQNLISGISFATDNFQHPKTTALAFEITALLLRKGAVRQKPSHTWQKHVRPKQTLQDTFSPFPTPKVAGQSGFKPKTPSPFFRGSPFPTKSTPLPQPLVERKDNQKEENEETPPDWLTPKVYKGSTLV